MQFQPDSNPNQNNVTRVEPQAIYVNQRPFYASLLLSPTEAPLELALRATHEIKADFWQQVIELAPEVLLCGTGAQQLFLPPATLAPLYAAGVGVECMSTQAAARTFNVLMSEGRRVLALLILPTSPNL